MSHTVRIRRSRQTTAHHHLETLEARTFLSVTTGGIPIPGFPSSSAPPINSGPYLVNSFPPGESGVGSSPVAQLPFDATLYYNKPLNTGMDNTLLLPSGNFAFWLFNKRLASLGNIDGIWDDPAKLTIVVKAAWHAGYRKFCMDDEGGDYLRIRRNIAVIRRAAPKMKIGVFCLTATYFNWSPEYMRSVNNRPEIRAILRAIDFSVPGIDLRWDMGTLEGRQSWLAFLKLSVAESKRVMPGKPCYPFLPIEYNPVFKSGNLSDVDMAWQLKQVAALHYTPIIWGGWRQEWKDSLGSRIVMK